jgi:hypothetical protein
MHAQAAAPDLATSAPGFAGRFTMIAAGLVALIARAFLRDPRLAPLILPLCGRINRTARRLAAVMAILARHGAIRHGATRRGEASDRGALAPRKRCRPLAPRTRCPIPTTPAWLIKILHHEAATYASQLSHLLAEPGVAELLDAAPTAKRLLRPLCRMLGLPDAKRSVAARQATSDTPLRGVARQATGVFPLKNPESVLAPSSPPIIRPPPCPHLAPRWPWYTSPAAKPA